MAKHSKAKSTEALSERLGYVFQDRALLERALTHGSALSGRVTHLDTYQRLEFLGDRVLGLTIAEMLIETYPHAEEGELSRRLNQLVRKETCADVARDLDFGPFLRMGESESRSGGRTKKAVLGDVCEAVIGALYLDGGHDVAARFVRTHWAERMQAQKVARRDAKTALQEWAQARKAGTPVYAMMARTGPDHAPIFTIEVRVEGVAPCQAQGASKKIAEHEAATAMLVREQVWEDTEHA